MSHQQHYETEPKQALKGEGHLELWLGKHGQHVWRNQIREPRSKGFALASDVFIQVELRHLEDMPSVKTEPDEEASHGNEYSVRPKYVPQFQCDIAQHKHRDSSNRQAKGRDLRRG